MSKISIPTLYLKYLTQSSEIDDMEFICIKDPDTNLLQIIGTSENINTNESSDINTKGHNVEDDNSNITNITMDENNECSKLEDCGIVNNVSSITEMQSIQNTDVILENDDNTQEELIKKKIPQSSFKEENDNETEKSEAVVTRVLSMLGFATGDLFSIKTNEGIRLWVCPVNECGHLFTRLFTLKTHILEHYRCKPFKCDIEDCNWSFYTAFKLKRHKEIHSGSKDYVCNEDGCPKRFTTIYNLRVHKKLHDRPKIHSCYVPECNELFSTKRELEKHLRNHDRAYAPYKCPVENCGNTYFSYSALTSHSRSHQYKINELQCQWENCGKIFEQPCRLKQHMRQHTGDKPYRCQHENCSSSFSSSSKLRRHERSHLNDRKYVCKYDDCGKSFIRNEHLSEHIAMRHEQKFILCPETDCGMAFPSKSCLYRHTANAHSIQKKIKKRKSTNKLDADLCIEQTTSSVSKDNESCNYIKIEDKSFKDPCDSYVDWPTICNNTATSESYNKIDNIEGSPADWIDFSQVHDVTSQNMQMESSNVEKFVLSDINASQSPLICEELQNLIKECTYHQTQSEFAVETDVIQNNVKENENLKISTIKSAENFSDINKFYGGIIFENGISVRIGNLSENLENNMEECYANNNQITEHSGTGIPLDIDNLRELIAAKNCILEVNEEGNVISILETEIESNSLPASSPVLIHDENNILETVKKKQNTIEDNSTCARTFLTYQQFCEDRTSRLNKSQFGDGVHLAPTEILENNPITNNENTIQNSSIDNNDMSYDVDSFEINEEYMTLINQSSSSAFQIQEVNDNNLDLNRSKLRLRAYSTTEDKLSNLCNESEIENINWGNKSLSDSNDDFNFEIKRGQITTSSLMQYEMIDSFNEKHSQSSLHDGIGELLCIDNLGPNFYETGETSSFTAHNVRSKDSI